jgi:hypothetical protein
LFSDKKKRKKKKKNMVTAECTKDATNERGPIKVYRVRFMLPHIENHLHVRAMKDSLNDELRAAETVAAGKLFHSVRCVSLHNTMCFTIESADDYETMHAICKNLIEPAVQLKAGSTVTWMTMEVVRV